MEHTTPFYGKNVCRSEDEEFVKEILDKYRGLPVDDALMQKVYDDLAWEKHLGRLTMPFKVEIKKDPYHRYPDFIEVLLETKV